MAIALGPNREIVDIHEPGQYEHWHGGGGLLCVVCGDKVHPYRLGNGNTWLRHNPGSEADRHALALGSRGESYEHLSLKHWLCGWLQSQGHQADYERQVGTSRPDVRALVSGRRIALEVQLSPLSLDEAVRRTGLLAAGGHEVLWLTRNRDWVDQLPAVGLHVEEEQPRYATTEVHGRFYSVREGFLTADSHGRIAPGKRPALETFLRHFVAGRVQWAVAGADRHGEHSGWATMDSWRQHTAWQARRLHDLESRLRAAESDRQRLDALVESRVRELDRTRDALAVEKAAAEDVRRQLSDSTSRLDAERAATEQRARESARCRELLQETFWGRRLLKRIGWS
ncbi:competence protein CoiA family protein [Modestobacter sp. SSW1-42]|uniref:competence protein CoiA family protein n=1 Tax=Modestobacter sp. SSW1-42 TaxID=596372 RepID=UPI003986309C